MVTLTREQLYKWVWSCPVSKIAEELGVSGSALGRKCRAHNVPTPGRGHWHQVARGKPVQRLPLPDPDSGSHQVPIKVSEERAAQLDLLSTSLAGPLATPPASDNLGNGPAAPTVLEIVEASRVPTTSGFAGGTPRPQVSLTEQGWPTNAAPADITALATLHSQSESARHFMEALREAGQDCDASTKAVLILWAGAARVFLAQSDPIPQVIEACRRVAAGKDNPEWWIALQQGNSGPR